MYIVISGVGGNVYYDPSPSVLYRQHDNNIIGSNLGMSARVRRVLGLITGRMQIWNEKNILALVKVKHELTLPNSQVLESFVQARTGWLAKRAIYLLRSGVYRQTLLGNIGLWVAVLLKRL